MTIRLVGFWQTIWTWSKFSVTNPDFLLSLEIENTIITHSWTEHICELLLYNLLMNLTHLWVIALFIVLHNHKTVMKLKYNILISDWILFFIKGLISINRNIKIKSFNFLVHWSSLSFVSVIFLYFNL